MQQPRTIKELFPQVGADGYFSNKTILQEPDAWTRGTIKEIGRNLFTSEDDRTYAYFIPAQAFGPFNSWACAKLNMYQVGFGTRVFLKRNVIVEESPKQQEEPVEIPELQIGDEYLFTNDPRKGFIRGTLLETPSEDKQARYFVASVDRGDHNPVEGKFSFCITEENFRQKRKDKLICANPARPVSMAQTTNRIQRINLIQDVNRRGLQLGEKVYWTHRPNPQSKNELGVGTFRGVSNNRFNIVNCGGVTRDAKYVFPASVIDNAIPNWQQLILAVKDNEIYAPHFI